MGKFSCLLYSFSHFLIFLFSYLPLILFSDSNIPTLKVVVGLAEAEGRISAVRSKFERQLQRLRERERLVEVSRQDCQREEAVLHGDRESHREQMEQVRWLVLAVCCLVRPGPFDRPVLLLYRERQARMIEWGPSPTQIPAAITA